MKILVSFFLLIASCQQNSYSRVNVIPIDTLKINEQISNYYYDDKNKNGYYINDCYPEIGSSLASITFINENTYKKEAVISINSETPVLYYNIINFDSIFATGYHTPNLVLFNKSGVLKEWDIDVFGTSEFYTSLRAFPPAIINNEFFFNIYSDKINKKINYSKEAEIQVNKIMGKLKIVNNRIESPQRFLNFPSDYHSDSIFCPFSWVRYIGDTAGKLIISFHMNDSLWVINGEKLTKYPAKSKYIDASIRLRKKHTHEEAVKFDNEVGYYFNIIYDKYRNLYYRVVFHNQKERNEDGTTNNRFNDRPWSIIVLDKNFNYIDEIIFSAKKYLSGRFLPTSRGILMTKRIDNGLFEEEGKMQILYKLELE